MARGFLRESRHQKALAGLSSQLEEIQSRLLDVGSAVATPLDTTKSAFKLNRTKFSAEAVLQVEVASLLWQGEGRAPSDVGAWHVGCTHGGGAQRWGHRC